MNMSPRPAKIGSRPILLLASALMVALTAGTVAAETETPPVEELHELQREHRSGPDASEYNLANGNTLRNHVDKMTEECGELLVDEDGEPVEATREMMMFLVLNERGRVQDVVTDPEHEFADCALELSGDFLYGEPPEAPWVLGGPME